MKLADPVMDLRPTRWLVSGMIDCTERGKVGGWLCFAESPSSLAITVRLDLRGDVHSNIRGCRVMLYPSRSAGSKHASIEVYSCQIATGKSVLDAATVAANSFASWGDVINTMRPIERGVCGDMGAPIGLQVGPGRVLPCAYFEWFPDEGYRTVIEMSTDEVVVVKEADWGSGDGLPSDDEISAEAHRAAARSMARCLGKGHKVRLIQEDGAGASVIMGFKADAGDDQKEG